ncbi:putative reverse transcriptase domain, reverse transcriptase zinc-binding domain protein [Tanacetum coccineum]
MFTLGAASVSFGAFSLVVVFVTMVTMGVVLAIALILTRVVPSVGSHRWRQLIDTKVRSGLVRDMGPPRCAFKVDIQKAYDTVDWCFLDNILNCFGFHPTMIKWIMACVSSTSFSLSLNGDIHGFFKGKRGLRQGDPLSPYLFTLVMEVLTLIMKIRVWVSDSFCYHNHCKDLQIINVCFADDLFIFARSEVDSASVIMDALDEFKITSGLVPSIPKSTAYFCNVRNHVKIVILNIMPFAEGKLPVKYLGVPLISSRLLIRTVKFLLKRSRTELEIGKQVFVFCWETPVQLIRGFLWCNGEYKRGKAKVAWEHICLPDYEGGLGIRSLEVFNIAVTFRIFSTPLLTLPLDPIVGLGVTSTDVSIPYTDFIKCQPLNFRELKALLVCLNGLVKMGKLVFFISSCALQSSEVVPALSRSALTVGYGHVRENDVAAFLADETKKVDKYISGLPDNIHGNDVCTTKTLDDCLSKFGPYLMDQGNFTLMQKG